ncbi:MAG: hypothetical protein FD168_1578 [Desulfobulbaceae bacterium]|nr:MAG: hypothetical protein FD168_1578 [Desulfobulbaceae bacterium]
MTTNATIEAIRVRAARFARDFSRAGYEMGEAQNFIRGLCEIFELPVLKAVSFEHRARKLGGSHGRIDGFFPGLLLIEMKSTGKDLALAYQQATEYLPNLPVDELPLAILVSDFTHIHLYDCKHHGEPLCFRLSELPTHIDALLFLAGYKSDIAQQQAAINQRAAEKMADLHDAMLAGGYRGRDLEVYLVRLVFCLFADDTALFGRNRQFHDYLVNHTSADGDDLHERLAKLFEVLDLKYENRAVNMPEYLRAFPYVNGSLFSGPLTTYYFDEASRLTLLACAEEDWSVISPEIFGSLFQAIMHFADNDNEAKSKKRREFGAHYTSEANIQKAIAPLFMEALREEFRSLMTGRQGRETKLRAFQRKLAAIKILDPACGCGNFLVVAYRELRMLELDCIEAIHGREMRHLDVGNLILCNVNQCYGIEIDEAAVQIATVALWLTDHQMNMAVGSRLGSHFARLPLDKKAHIVYANALQIDWREVLPPEQCSYIVGNPPFIGQSYQSKEQKAELAAVFAEIKGAGVLDYVAAWYVKAAEYIKAAPSVPVAFVSTNSICQGEQVGILWKHLLAQGVTIHFAHRTFRWSNEGKGVAAVHCVIVGFGLSAPKNRTLFDYGDDIAGEPVTISAKTINPYLVDAPTVLLDKRRKPLWDAAPEMSNGGKPTDGGHLLLSPEEADAIRHSDPIAAKYIRPFLMGEDFINNLPRYCLWLIDSTAQDRKDSPEIQRRMLAVAAMRLASPKVPTQKLAATPYLFGEIRISSASYLAIPKVSSERRHYIPIGYLPADVICGDQLLFMPNASLTHFGILCSTMHNAWMRTVCGRLKSDYRYSNTIVYNNFPWSASLTTAHTTKIEAAAQAILDARGAEESRCAAQGQKCSLATLYAPGNLPIDLLKAHAALDKAVDTVYGYKGVSSDAERVAFLFECYEGLLAKR